MTVVESHSHLQTHIGSAQGCSGPKLGPLNVQLHVDGHETLRRLLVQLQADGHAKPRVLQLSQQKSPYLQLFPKKRSRITIRHHKSIYCT